MRHSFLLVILVFFTKLISANPQVTISLVTDQGIKTAEYLRFSISGPKGITHDFIYNKFSKEGKYPNSNLFQYNQDIDTGSYTVNILFKTNKSTNTADSVLVDNTTGRVEIYVFISTSPVNGDYIKEVKTLKYQSVSEYLKFYQPNKFQLGSEAKFRIENIGSKPVYGYPNNAFFFGTLHIEAGNDSWTQHYPLYIDIKYCDTLAAAKPLASGQFTEAWTPNDKDCSAYKFVQPGSYFFELLYLTENPVKSVVRGLTKFTSAAVYRQIFEFRI